jgi:hypothetical protein
MSAPSLAPTFDAIARLDADAAHSDQTRKQAGITYTPVAIARSMVELAQPHPDERIHEPACGRGVFVFALVEHWLNQGKDLAWVDRWAQVHLRCGDLDATAVTDLRRLWLDFFASHGHTAAPLHAVVEDGLFGPQAQQPTDLILGNPPYVRIQHLPEVTRDRLRAKYVGCAKGNVDLYYAFFEDALRRTKRVCYIMPNSWLANASAQALRGLVRPTLSALIDFEARLMFAPVRAYTAIVVCDQAAGDTVRVRGNLPEEGGDWQTVARADARWSLARFQPLLHAPLTADITLHDVAEVVSGIATLADPVFLWPTPERFQRNGKAWVRQADPLTPQERPLEVPERYAPRLLKATKQLGPPTAEGPRVLYPYNAQRQIVSEAQLAQEAPDLLVWLGRRRGALDARDKGKTDGYDAWYAYGRKQGFWSPDPGEAVLLMPQMGNGRLSCVTVDTAAVGPFLFTSGFVVRRKATSPLSLAEIAAQLTSATAWAFVQQEGRAWAGAGDYRTIGARALRRLPFP